MNDARDRLAIFWLRQFFRLCERAPQLLYDCKTPLCKLAFVFSKSIQNGTRKNAARILGLGATPLERDELAHRMLESFYLFCCDVGQSRSATREELKERIASIHGHETFVSTRASRKGAIILTAHMGSFEVGLAALREIEPHIHVIFRRDRIDEFEQSRRELRKRLDVREAPIDEGWPTWIAVRDALLRDEAVVIQGDRVLPGQKGHAVPFLSGHLELPQGPVKLARITGSPIIPVYSVRRPDGKIQLFVEEAIHADGTTADTLAKIAVSLEKYVRKFPDQWLILHPALLEDQTR